MFNRIIKSIASVIASVALAATGLVAASVPAHAVGVPALAWAGTNGAATTYALQTMTLSGTTPTQAVAPTIGTALAADSSSFYFTQGSDLVKSDLTGANIQVVAAGVASSVVSVAVQGSSLYLYEPNNGIFKVSTSGGVPTRFDIGASVFHPVAASWSYGNQIGASSTDLFWVESDGVHTQALNGTSDTLFATNAALTFNSNDLGVWVTVSLAVTNGMISVSGSNGSGMADFWLYDTTAGSPSWSHTAEAFNNWPTVSYAMYVAGLGFYNGYIYFDDGNGWVYKVDAAGTDQTTVFKDPNQNYAAGLAFYSAASSYTVTFDANGGTGTMAAQTASSATNLTANAFTKANHVFAFWSTSTSCSFDYNDSGSYPFTSSTTLYACWRGAGQISETLNGSAASAFAFGTVSVGSTNTKQFFLKNIGDSTSLSGTISNSSISTGVGLAAVGAANGSTAACNFSGGSLSYGQSCAFTVTWAPGSALTLTTGSHSLDIQLNGNIYSVAFSGTAVTTKTVTFDANLGTGTMANQVSATTANLTANSFTRGGFVFAGWNTVANGSGTAYADLAAYAFSANATLYAQWTPAASGGIDSSVVRLGPVVERQIDPTATTVTLTGFNLNKVTSVAINGVSVQFTVVGAGQISVVLPKLEVGACNVAVTGSGFSILMPAAFRVVTKVDAGSGTGSNGTPSVDRTFSVYFAAGSYALSAKTIAALQAKLAALKAAGGRIVVTAWAQSTADNRGDALLSANRAKAILGWLKSHGIKASAASGKGTLDSSAASRRADVTYATQK